MIDNIIHPNTTTGTIIHHTYKIVLELITRNNYSLDNLAITTTAFMDPCWKATSSISEDLKEPPTLVQSSDVIFDNNQHKMNDLISKTEVNGCDVEQIDESVSNQMTAKVKTIVTFPSSTKKIRSGCMKMLGHGVIASSNLFLLDFCQDLEDIDY